ncbi:alpha/beta fold hydrolase [Flavobacteriaceae bacterium 3-367]|uniref:alpha/beta fold hydrolase n=1 Tax=Eudoraea algarum TaxID=3417568 RepID=UPI00329255C0
MQQLHSKILGEGKPLVILHGFLGMSDNWKTLGAQYAKAGFQVHLIDQRNHGRSFHSDAFDYDILADDILGYTAQHGIGQAIVMGHSMGGKTAMQLATDQSQLVEKLVVADIAPKFYPPHHQDIVDALNTISIHHISSRGQADEALSRYIPDLGIRQFLLKNLYWADKERLGFRFNLPVLSQKMEEIGENIPPTAQYSGPTLFLRGDRSEYISPDDYPGIKRHFPQAKIEVIDNAGHWLHAENPQQFFTKSMAFLNS